MSSPSFVSCTWVKARLNMSWKISRSVNGDPCRTYIATYQGSATARMIEQPADDLEAQQLAPALRVVATYAKAQRIGSPKPAGPFAHRRDRREEPGRDVEEAPRAALAPVHVEHERRETPAHMRRLRSAGSCSTSPRA